MSLLEWFGESYCPGPVGRVSLKKGRHPDRTRGIVLLRLFLALLLAGGWVYLVFGAWDAAPTLKSVCIFLGGTAAYLAAGYFLRPEPDYSNIGWLGGLWDHPLRYSDDLNRMLLFLKVFLLPGQFMAESLVEGVILLKHLSSFGEEG
jgi:hypothetical protein